jgi:hypothetical protein
MAEKVAVYRRAFRLLVGKATGQGTDQRRVMSGQTAAVRGDVVLLARAVDASEYLPCQDLTPGSPTIGKFYFIMDVDRLDDPNVIPR